VKLATWNVNSIRARVDVVAAWLERARPDVLCMQETKVVDDAFPIEAFTRLGYSVQKTGQPTYNGVAIASRLPLEDVCIDLPGGDDKERRLIAATVSGLRVVNVYVPNGKSVTSPSFQFKLEWLRRLRTWLDRSAGAGQKVLVCGDFNVAREPRDVFDPVRLDGQLLYHPEERRALEHFLEFGFEDLYRRHHDAAGQFSWWDYRAGALRLNRGFRIDYVFATRPLAELCRSAEIDAAPRKGDKPSDHAPVVVELDV
jgi:exodeoxyribonuclease-3